MAIAGVTTAARQVVESILALVAFAPFDSVVAVALARNVALGRLGTVDVARAGNTLAVLVLEESFFALFATNTVRVF